MGAWGSGSFENDTASDWAFGLEGVNDTSLIESTLEKVIGVGAEYLQAPDAEEGLAAAETVARMKGQRGARNSYTEPMDRWVERLNWRPSSELVRKAVVVVDRILSEPSRSTTRGKHRCRISAPDLAPSCPLQRTRFARC